MNFKLIFLMSSSLIVTALVTIVICLFTFSPLNRLLEAKDQPLQRTPIGELGRRLGKRSNITGYLIEDLKEKGTLMQITEIDGLKAPRNITMPLQNFKLIPGVVYELEGCELGYYEGDPSGVSYHPFFDVKKVLKIDPGDSSNFPNPLLPPSS